MTNVPHEVLAHIVSFVKSVPTFLNCLLVSKSFQRFIISEQPCSVGESVTFQLSDPSFFTKQVVHASDAEFSSIHPRHYVRRLVVPIRIVVETEPTTTLREAFPHLVFLEVLKGAKGEFATSIFRDVAAPPMAHLLIWAKWDSNLEGLKIGPLGSSLESLSFSRLRFGPEWNATTIPRNLKKLHLFDTTYPKLPTEITGEIDPQSLAWKTSLTHLYLEYLVSPQVESAPVVRAYNPPRFRLRHTEAPYDPTDDLAELENATPAETAFLRSFPNLEVVYFRGVQNISSAKYFVGLRDAQKLRKVSVLRCSGMYSREEVLVEAAVGGAERIGELEEFCFVGDRMKKGKMKAPSPLNLLASQAWM